MYPPSKQQQKQEAQGASFEKYFTDQGKKKKKKNQNVKDTNVLDFPLPLVDIPFLISY